LIQIPVAGDYIRVLNTVIHESGHALIALCGGHLEKVVLMSNSEGVTYGPKSGKLEGIVSSMSGYICSSLMGLVSFWLIKKEKYTVLIDLLLAIIFINLILWVRNPFGVIWLVVFAFGFLLLLIKGTHTLIYHFLLLIASILLVDSIKSSIEIFAMSMVHPMGAGDAANLFFLTMIVPVQAWGGFFFIQSLVFPLISFKKGFFRVKGTEMSE
jgi:hypothetical protein